MKEGKSQKYEKAYIIELSSGGYYINATTPEELHNMKDSQDGRFNYIKKCLYAAPNIHSDRLVFVDRALCPHFRRVSNKRSIHSGIASLPESFEHKCISLALSQTSTLTIIINNQKIKLIRRQDLPSLKNATIIGKKIIPDAHIYAEYIIDGTTYHELFIEVHNTSPCSPSKLKTLEIAQKPALEFDLPILDFDWKMSQQKCIAYLIKLLENEELVLSGAFMTVNEQIHLDWTNNNWGIQAIYKGSNNHILIYFFQYHSSIKIWYCWNNCVASRTLHLGKTIKTREDARILARYDIDEFIKGRRNLDFKPSSRYLQNKYNFTTSL